MVVNEKDCRVYESETKAIKKEENSGNDVPCGFPWR